jgi:hypothetical protein
MARGNDDEFGGPPAAGDQLKPNDLIGEDVVIHPLEYVERIETSFGDTDAVRCNVLVLTGDEAGEYRDTLLFNRALVGALKRVAGSGKKVVGTLGHGEAKKGQSPAVILNDPSAALLKSAQIAWKKSGLNGTVTPSPDSDPVTF